MERALEAIEEENEALRRTKRTAEASLQVVPSIPF